MGTIASVVLTVRNVGKQIGPCLTSLLDQTVNDFDIVIVDDVSKDNTEEIIEKFDDRRIRYFRNEKWLGLAASRNKCLAHATGDYIFFTDGDCVVSKNWIEEGLEYLKASECIGVEGRTYYVSKNYESTRSDDVVENITGGQYPTCNMAYTKHVLREIGGFDERFTYMEDRDLAFRAKKLGIIGFNPDMTVFHQKKKLNWREFVRKTKIIRNRVLIYEKFHDKTFFVWRIWYPMNLVAIFFPPLIVHDFFSRRYKTREDFALFPFTYLNLILERLNLWYMCARERVFLI